MSVPVANNTNVFRSRAFILLMIAVIQLWWGVTVLSTIRSDLADSNKPFTRAEGAGWKVPVMTLFLFGAVTSVVSAIILLALEKRTRNLEIEIAALRTDSKE